MAAWASGRVDHGYSIEVKAPTIRFSPNGGVAGPTITFAGKTRSSIEKLSKLKKLPRPKPLRFPSRMKLLCAEQLDGNCPTCTEFGSG